MSLTQTEAKQSLAFFSGAHFSAAKPTFSRATGESGREELTVSGMPVFRAGTFRDSMGYESSWDAFHMEQMVANFGLLTGRHIMDNLPVRAGHPSPFTNPMNELIGHVASLSTGAFTSPSDGVEYTYLLADFIIRDLKAADSIESGLWVNRSAEIGMYETNDGMGFYPTFMGFAYVDIPAVEGLNFSRASGFNKNFVVACDDELKEAVSVAGETNQGGTFEFTLSTGPTKDFSAVQAHIAGIESENAALKTKNAELESFQKETTTANRANFVKSLISGNKLLAAQEESVVQYVGTLSPEQFAQYQSIMDGSPQVPLLGNHAASTQAGGTPDVDQNAETDVELESAKAVYQRHVIAGMKETDLKNTASYKTLVAKGYDFKK